MSNTEGTKEDTKGTRLLSADELAGIAVKRDGMMHDVLPCHGNCKLCVINALLAHIAALEVAMLPACEHDGACDRCGVVPSVVMPTHLCDECADGVRRAEKAEAALADANASLALCAENTAAADLAQEVEFLKAELAGLGPVEWQYREHPTVRLWGDCSEKFAQKKMEIGIDARAFRAVLTKEHAEAGANLRAENERLREALGNVMGAIKSLCDESHGVAGLHLNGDVAPWGELLEGGRFEEWTEPAFSTARAMLERKL